jgi:hypothetical protein
MNQTPTQSNLSRRRLPAADEGTQTDVETTASSLIDVEATASSLIIRGLFKAGGGQRTFDKLNAGLLSVCQAFIVGDDKAAEKENVLLHLIRESGKALPLLLDGHDDKDSRRKKVTFDTHMVDDGNDPDAIEIGSWGNTPLVCLR